MQFRPPSARKHPKSSQGPVRDDDDDGDVDEGAGKEEQKASSDSGSPNGHRIEDDEDDARSNYAAEVYGGLDPDADDDDRDGSESTRHAGALQAATAAAAAAEAEAAAAQAREKKQTLEEVERILRAKKESQVIDALQALERERGRVGAEFRRTVYDHYAEFIATSSEIQRLQNRDLFSLRSMLADYRKTVAELRSLSDVQAYTVSATVVAPALKQPPRTLANQSQLQSLTAFVASQRRSSGPDAAVSGGRISSGSSDVEDEDADGGGGEDDYGDDAVLDASLGGDDASSGARARPGAPPAAAASVSAAEVTFSLEGAIEERRYDDAVTIATRAMAGSVFDARGRALVDALAERLCRELRKPVVTVAESIRVVDHLKSLQRGPKALGAYLESRSLQLQREIRKIRFDGNDLHFVTELSRVSFSLISATLDDFRKVFPDPRFLCALVQWGSDEVEHVIARLQRQVFSSTDYKLVTGCVEIAKIHCKVLDNKGYSLVGVFSGSVDGLLCDYGLRAAKRLSQFASQQLVGDRFEPRTFALRPYLSEDAELCEFAGSYAAALFALSREFLSVCSLNVSVPTYLKVLHHIARHVREALRLIESRAASLTDDSLSAAAFSCGFLLTEVSTNLVLKQLAATSSYPVHLLAPRVVDAVALDVLDVYTRQQGRLAQMALHWDLLDQYFGAAQPRATAPSRVVVAFVKGALGRRKALRRVLPLDDVDRSVEWFVQGALESLIAAAPWRGAGAIVFSAAGLRQFELDWTYADEELGPLSPAIHDQLERFVEDARAAAGALLPARSPPPESTSTGLTRTRGPPRAGTHSQAIPMEASKAPATPAPSAPSVAPPATPNAPSSTTKPQATTAATPSSGPAKAATPAAAAPNPTAGRTRRGAPSSKPVVVTEVMLDVDDAADGFLILGGDVPRPAAGASGAVSVPAVASVVAAATPARKVRGASSLSADDADPRPVEAAPARKVRGPRVT